MGTINFKTTEYITIGYKPISYDDNYYNDLFNYYQNEYPDFNDYQIENIINDCISDDYNYIYEDAERIINKYDFNYFDVSIISGYYESYQLDFEWFCNYYGFEDYQEKLSALKEATQFKKMLLELLDIGFCVCYPGWCTGYADRSNSIKEINSAIKKIKSEIRNELTWYKYQNTESKCYQ